MIGVQLSLFDIDNVQGACPHCGHAAPLPAFVPDRRAAVLADPRIQALPDSTRGFLQAAPDAFLLGMSVGVAQIERQTPYTKSAAHKQLRRLVAAGLVQPRPKRPGGSYCQYRLVLNGAARP